MVHDPPPDQPGQNSRGEMVMGFVTRFHTTYTEGSGDDGPRTGEGSRKDDRGIGVRHDPKLLI